MRIAELGGSNRLHGIATAGIPKKNQRIPKRLATY
jgi:hypothetical protein